MEKRNCLMLNNDILENNIDISAAMHTPFKAKKKAIDIQYKNDFFKLKK